MPEHRCDGFETHSAIDCSGGEGVSQLVWVNVSEAGRDGEDFAMYLAVKAFPDLDLYKRLEDAIDAANAGRLPLTVAGFGPERARLVARAYPGPGQDPGLNPVERMRVA